MNVNELKNIINTELGFEKKSIEIMDQKTDRFGGMIECIFKVKNETYIIAPDGNTLYFNFYTLEADQEEPTEAPADHEDPAETPTEEPQEDTTEADETEATNNA